MWQGHDKVMGIRLLGGGDDLLPAGLRFAIADIVGDCPGKEIEILLDNADVLSQRTQANFPDVSAVEQDLSCADFIKARDQRTKSRFAGA